MGKAIAFKRLLPKEKMLEIHREYQTFLDKTKKEEFDEHKRKFNIQILVQNKIIITSHGLESIQTPVFVSCAVKIQDLRLSHKNTEFN